VLNFKIGRFANQQMLMLGMREATPEVKKLSPDFIMLDKVCPRSYVNRDKAATKNTWAKLKEHLHWRLLMHLQQAKIAPTVTHLRWHYLVESGNKQDCNVVLAKETRLVEEPVAFTAFCDSFGPCYLDSFRCLFMTYLIYGFLATLA